MIDPQRTENLYLINVNTHVFHYFSSQIKLQYLTNLSQLHKISIIEAITEQRKKTCFCLDSCASIPTNPPFFYYI